MAVGNKIETRGHIIGFKEEISKAAAINDDLFFTWFDSAKDKHAAFIRGNWDFMIRIALPCSPYLANPENKIALEIGHGGGRILAAACNYFQKVVGVDIHDNNDKVDVELKSKGLISYQLMQTNGNEIPVEDSSIDLVYSFIVLQHVEKISIFKNYLKEAFRILKAGGLAVLYFGRKGILSNNKRSKILFLMDKLAEPFLLPKGFQEIQAKVNCTNLVISLSHAKLLAKKEGFTVLSQLVSHKSVPDGIQLFGGQHGLVLKKNKD